MRPRLPVPPDAPRSPAQAAELNDLLHRKAVQRTYELRGPEKESARAIVDATHEAAKRLIASYLDPEYVSPTILDLSQLPKEERQVEANDLAELADLVRLGVRTKQDVEKLLTKIGPVVEVPCACAVDSPNAA